MSKNKSTYKSMDKFKKDDSTLKKLKEMGSDAWDYIKGQASTVGVKSSLGSKVGKAARDRRKKKEK
jgi:hypothetical protein